MHINSFTLFDRLPIHAELLHIARLSIISSFTLLLPCTRRPSPAAWKTERANIRRLNVTTAPPRYRNHFERKSFTFHIDFSAHTQQSTRRSHRTRCLLVVHNRFEAADTSAAHAGASGSSVNPSAVHVDLSATQADSSATQAGSSAVTANIPAQWAFSTGPSVSIVPTYASATPIQASHTAASASATRIHTGGTASATLPYPSGPNPFPKISPSDPLHPPILD